MPLGRALMGVALQLLLPFALGQAFRPLIGNWLARKKQITNKIDRGVIVLIVYSSFCDATAAGLWHQYSWQTIGAVMGIAAILLFVILGTTTFTARRLGFSVEDEITAVFCGSKKSLANGIPMAKILFAGHPALGLLVHPAFWGLSAFVGAGLFVAGATGFCGMARLLAVMPWNRTATRPVTRAV